MGKIAFVFPGQGAQYPGMGKDIYDKFEESKDAVKKANERLGFDISDIVFTGSEEELSKTEITQPAILMTSIAIAEVLKSYNIKPDAVAGLSLGEYSALVSSGAIDYEAAVELVRKRGIYMEEAASGGSGSMAAVLGLDKEPLLEIVQSLKKDGVIEIANYNCPGQLVISGQSELIDKACEMAKESGAKRAVKLQVSGPFHTSLLDEAGKNLKEALSEVDIKEPGIDMYFNVNAEKIKETEKIKEALVAQVSNSVLWENIIEKMLLEDEIEEFVEVGPGKTLTSFIKKINKKHKKDIKLFNIEDLESLEVYVSQYNA